MQEGLNLEGALILVFNISQLIFIEALATQSKFLFQFDRFASFDFLWKASENDSLNKRQVTKRRVEKLRYQFFVQWILSFFILALSLPSSKIISFHGSHPATLWFREQWFILNYFIIQVPKRNRQLFRWWAAIACCNTDICNIVKCWFEGIIFILLALSSLLQ